MFHFSGCNINANINNFLLKIFQFIRDDYGSVSSMPFSLQRYETKTLFVVFDPHVLGACEAHFIFTFGTHTRSNVDGKPTQMVITTIPITFFILQLSLYFS